MYYNLSCNLYHANFSEVTATLVTQMPCYLAMKTSLKLNPKKQQSRRDLYSPDDHEVVFVGVV